MQYNRTEESEMKKEILNQIKEIESHRNHLDLSVKLIGALLYGPIKGPSILNSVRLLDLPLVDDWGCMKRVVTHHPICFS